MSRRIAQEFVGTVKSAGTQLTFVKRSINAASAGQLLQPELASRHWDGSSESSGYVLSWNVKRLN